MKIESLINKAEKERLKKEEESSKIEFGKSPRRSRRRRRRCRARVVFQTKSVYVLFMYRFWVPPPFPSSLSPQFLPLSLSPKRNSTLSIAADTEKERARDSAHTHIYFPNLSLSLHILVSFVRFNNRLDFFYNFYVFWKRDFWLITTLQVYDFSNVRWV